MSSNTRVLLIIGAFVAVMVISFLWFIATWDPAREEPVSTLPPQSEVA